MSERKENLRGRKHLLHLRLLRPVEETGEIIKNSFKLDRDEKEYIHMRLSDHFVIST